MRSLKRNFLLVVMLGVCSWAAARPAESTSQGNRLLLRDGWKLQSSCKVEEKGEVLSTPRFQPKGWYPVTVPTTVVAALVKNKVYPDPYFGMNLRALPGMAYPIGDKFSSLPTPQDSPFIVPWWYRKEFVIPRNYQGKTIWLRFGGITYRANIWLNGKRIASTEDVAGTWRTYEFNVTDVAQAGKSNVLAVQVFSPSENDLAITFWDWNPAPPDKHMGIFRDVELAASGPVALRYAAVSAKVDSPASDRAHLTVTSLLRNATNQPVKGRLTGRIGAIEFSQDVELKPNETRDVSFEPAQYAQLNILHPRLWWPRQMGTPTLYDLSMEFETGGQISDHSETKFGIREITSELNEHHHLVFSINGRKILIRGGGWAMDMLLREDPRRVEDEFRYVEDMGLNTIRLEGMLETEQFFELADQKGILLMPGWVCCSHWQHWENWKPQDFVIAEQSLRDQIYRMRSHPSLLVWLNGSDEPPPPDVEQMFLNVEKDLRWPNPVLSSASAEATSLTGYSGVKMTGPYDYVAPGYWEQDSIDTRSTHKECKESECGGGYGFNTETSMGPAVPPIESIRAMVGKAHLWPIDDFWNYHTGGGVFRDIHLFTDALDARYGKAETVDDFALKSQLMAYEGVRAMYEAYSRNKYASTGVIQWMLNNAWPSMIWHLYDYYLRPGGGYFGAKIAMQPLHPLYGYDDHSIWVVNSGYQDVKGLQLSVKVLNLDTTEKFSQQIAVDINADGTEKVLALPEITGLSDTYFILLRLQDASGRQVGSNFYWLPNKPETLDWDKSNWYTTPTANFADYTSLARLPKIKLNVTSKTERKNGEAFTRVTIENPSQTLAFFVRLKVNKGNDEILPVIWEDNYISLLPGEKRTITAAYRASQLGTANPSVEVSGWNVVGR